MTRVLTLGLDGAAWHRLDALIETGHLPNIAALAAEGARGPLRSVAPPVTCPAWRCSTSGKNPGRLGVYWWVMLDRATGSMRTPDATDFDTADTWDYLTEAGKSSAVLNVPMTYPPAPLDGVMVSGFGSPFELDLDEPITHPPEFRERLQQEYDWAIGVDDVTSSDGVDRVCDLIEARFELLLDLLEEGYDYLHLTVFYINVLQHKYGDGPETRRAWELIDEYVGKLPDDITTILYSDHGHRSVDRTFAINTYLADRGYLEFEQDTGENLTGWLYSVFEEAGIDPRRVAARFPDQIVDRVIDSGYPVATADVPDRVDWHQSMAVAVSQGPIYLNRARLGDEYEAFRDSLQRDLASLQFDGDCPISTVRQSDAVYDGQHVDTAPDLVAVPEDGWELYGGLLPSAVESQATSWTSGNHPVGMVLFHGPDVADRTLPERSLLDVMPTVLRKMGCPVPEDIDGTAIEAAFTEPLPETGTREPLASVTGDRRSSDELEQRLLDLGYLE